ncbi:hypothetical protein [Blautia sp. HCP28S3_G10]|uniref:hypothetical protein n=1 Tax=Blautia sp. HCP28S3_G10 TaxID=3438908 RepID=UPI003F8B65F6
MSSIFLAVSVVAIFAFGYFIVKKEGSFLGESKKEREKEQDCMQSSKKVTVDNNSFDHNKIE